MIDARPERTQVRRQVLNGLADGIGPVLLAIDELEAALRAKDRVRARAAVRRCTTTRDALLNPIIERYLEGREL